MDLIKANSTTQILAKTIAILLVFNLIAPNFLIFRDMISSLDLSYFIYFLIQAIVCGISFLIGLEIKRVNIDILKNNNRAGFGSKYSLVFLILSIISSVVCLYSVQNPYIGDNKFFIDRYIDYFYDGVFLSSLGFGIFAVFGTDTNLKYPTEQELKTRRRVILKRVLLYTSPITLLFAVYLIYIYSYRVSISDFSYFNADDIESIKINYNDSRQYTSYETQEEISTVLDIISQYTFSTNITTFIPHSQYMSQRILGNETGKESLLITVIYKDYDKQVEYLSFLEDGRLRITSLKDDATYELSQADATKLFSEIFDIQNLL